jgi:hypothetical protein
VRVSYLFLATLALLSGCGPADQQEQADWQPLYCRDDGNPAMRQPLYRAKVPLAWKRKEQEGSVVDTSVPICQFDIGTQDSQVQLTVHSFLVAQVEQRIPPAVQIARWKRQFDLLDPYFTSVELRSQGGFTGFSLSAQGIIKGEEKGVIAYSMQLAPMYFFALQAMPNATFKQKQMAADYTIKAIGPIAAITRYKSDIELFANSFELIEELPAH